MKHQLVQQCFLGKIYVSKTDDNYVFRKFTLVCAIYNSKCVGATFYRERFVEFIQQNIFNII